MIRVFRFHAIVYIYQCYDPVGSLEFVHQWFIVQRFANESRGKCVETSFVLSPVAQELGRNCDIYNTSSLYQRSRLICRVIIGISQLIWSESLFKVHRGSYLSLLCLYDLHSRSQQLKVERKRDSVHKSSFDKRQIERHLEPDIVLTGNRGGVEGGSRGRGTGTHCRAFLATFISAQIFPTFLT